MTETTPAAAPDKQEKSDFSCVKEARPNSRQYLEMSYVASTAFVMLLLANIWSRFEAGKAVYAKVMSLASLEFLGWFFAIFFIPAFILYMSNVSNFNWRKMPQVALLCSGMAMGIGSVLVSVVSATVGVCGACLFAVIVVGYGVGMCLKALLAIGLAGIMWAIICVLINIASVERERVLRDMDLSP